MILNVNDDYVVEEVTKAHIKKCIGKLKADKFAVLEKDDENFMQIYIGDEPDDSVIEYHEGKLHFQSPMIDVESTVKAFSLYLVENDKFQECLPWMQAVIYEDEYED